MPEPTPILTHSEDALARLINWAGGRQRIETLLRSKSAYRVDIPAFAVERYAIQVLNCVAEHSAIEGQTEGDIAASIAAQIAGADSAPIESFETFDVDTDFIGAGIHGSWGVTPGGPPGPPAPERLFVVDGDFSALGTKSIRSKNELGLPVVVSPTITQEAYISGWRGNDDAIQTFKIKIRLDTDWRASVPAGVEVWPIGLSISGSGSSVGFALLYNSGPDFDLANGLFGIGVPTSIAIPGAYLDDGEFHEIEMTMDLAGTFVNLSVDDGAFVLNSVGAGLIAAASLTVGVYNHNMTASEATTVKNVYFDDLEFGDVIPCGEFILDEAVNNSADNLESFTPAATPFTGTSHGVTWSGPDIFGPNPAFKGPLLSSTVSPRSGLICVATDFASGIADPTGAGSFLHTALATPSPFITSPIRRIEKYIQFDAGFRTAAEAILPFGVGLLDATIMVDLTTFNGFLGALVLGNGLFGLDGWNIGLGLLGPPTEFEPVTANIDDGGYHRLAFEVNDLTGTVAMEIDDQRVEVVLPGFTPFGEAAPWIAFTQQITGAVPGAPFVLPEIRYDDISVGVDIPFKFDASAKHVNPEDPYFYVFRTGDVGEDLPIEVLT